MNNGIFDEKSIAEAVQETVHDNVEMLLNNLEKSPENDNLPTVRDLQSPNHHITSITTSTSSLAIDDVPLPQPSPLSCQTVPSPSTGSASDAVTEKNNCENLIESQKECLFVDLPEGKKAIEQNAEKENGNKYFPVFYKSPTNKKLAE